MSENNIKCLNVNFIHSPSEISLCNISSLLLVSIKSTKSLNSSGI